MRCSKSKKHYAAGTKIVIRHMLFGTGHSVYEIDVIIGNNNEKSISHCGEEEHAIKLFNLL